MILSTADMIASAASAAVLIGVPYMGYSVPGAPGAGMLTDVAIPVLGQLLVGMLLVPSVEDLMVDEDGAVNSTGLQVADFALLALPGAAAVMFANGFQVSQQSLMQAGLFGLSTGGLMMAAGVVLDSILGQRLIVSQTNNAAMNAATHAFRIRA